MHHWAKAIYFESVFDYESAIESFEKVLQINPELESARYAILFNKARLGNHDKEVRDYIDGTTSDSGEDLMKKALLYAGLEDADQTIHYYLQAIEKNVYPSDILVDKNYNFLRSHDQYPALLSEFNLD